VLAGDITQISLQHVAEVSPANMKDSCS